jgi:hypothetical protein
MKHTGKAHLPAEARASAANPASDKLATLTLGNLL